jgi:hypothetical protein
MIKDAICEYYAKLDKLWLEKRATHPLIPYIDKIEPFNMYIGTKNQSGYVEWTIRKNSNTVDFAKISENTGIDFTDGIKQYFSSYWFLKMTGLYGSTKVSFTPLTPLVDALIFVTERFNIAKSQKRDINKIEIGIAEIDHNDGYLLIYDNHTGNVEAFDADQKSYQFIAKSLELLITQMEPRC